MVLTVGNCPPTENGREKIIFLTIRGQKKSISRKQLFRKVRSIIGNIYTTAYTNLGFAIDGQNQTVRDILRETDKTVSDF